MSKGARVTKLHKDKVDEVKADLEMQLEQGKKVREEKLEQSKAHLQRQLEVTAEKYLTVNGYLQARTVLEQVAFGLDDSMDDFSGMACGLARAMSSLASTLSSKLSEISVEDLDDTFLEGLLDKNFVSDVKPLTVTTEQLLVVELLQNIGPVIEGIVGFRESTDHGLAAIVDELANRTGHVPGQLMIDDDGQSTIDDDDLAGVQLHDPA
jgi:hypothetical protein